MTTDAYGYLRQSSYDGVSLSIPGQRKDIEAFAKREGLRIVEWFTDRDRSARRGSPPRPEYERMLGKLDALPPGGAIVAWRMDRMTRGGIVEFGRTIEDHLEPRKLRFASATEVYLNNLETNPFAEVVLVLVATFAKMESDAISLRTGGSRRMTRAAGRWTSGSAPFGFRVDTTNGRHLVAVPDEADAIRHVVRMVMAGGSISQAAQYLTASPFQTRRGNDTFARRTVTSMLSTPTLAGWVSHNDAPLLGEDGLPVSSGEAIIEPEEWRALQALLDARRTGKVKVRTNAPLLRGLVRCSECDYRMRGQGSEPYRGYQCPSRFERPGVCPDGGTISMRETDALVIRALRAAIPAALTAGARARAAKAKAKDRTGDRIEGLRQAIAQGEARHAQLRAAGASASRLAEVDKQQAALDAELLSLTEDAAKRAVATDFGAVERLLGSDPLVRFDAIVEVEAGPPSTVVVHDAEALRTLLAYMVERVTVAPRSKPGRGFEPERVDVALRR